MPSPLTTWLDKPASDRGIHLADSAGGWQYSSYPELAAGARAVAAELADRGIRAGDVISLVLPTDHTGLTTFFGTWAAGAVVSPIAPPAVQTDEEYVAQVATVLKQARPAAVLTSPTTRTLVARAAAMAGRPDDPWVVEPGSGSLLRASGEQALLQFTSGSTGSPRGIRISWQSLDANIAAIHKWTRWKDGEGTASWLPFYHDMGLVGCLLATVAAQGDLWLMNPGQFVRDPKRWLAALAQGGVRRTASPTFGYAYAVSRLRPQDVDGLDLSNVRQAIVGAERVDASTLAAFAALLRGTGFRPEALKPAYGLAEATLFVTGSPGTKLAAAARIDRSGIRFGQPVPVKESGGLPADPDEAGSDWLVGCGQPHGGLQVAVVGDDGEELPNGWLGEIRVAGTSVADGYAGDQASNPADNRDDESTRFDGSQLLTGDAGFILGQDLFVLGRMGESLKVRGRAIYMEDLEARTAAAAGVDRSRCAAVSSTGDGSTGVALFVETAAGSWVTDAVQGLRREIGGQSRITVITGKRGLIRRTSSGKPRRRHLWNELHNGTASGTVVYDSHPSDGQTESDREGPTWHAT